MSALQVSLREANGFFKVNYDKDKNTIKNKLPQLFKDKEKEKESLLSKVLTKRNEKDK